MTTYDLGDPVPIGVATFNDSTGLPENATSATLVITKPDGTTTSVITLSNPSTGVYTTTYTPAAAGRYRPEITVVGTSTVSGGVYEDVFDVWPADPRFIVSVDDIKSELSVRSGTTIDEDELRLYCAAATQLVEEIAGTVLATTLVETHNGGRAAVLLEERPTAITSVVVDGTALAAADYTADLASGIVYAGGSRTPTSFAWGRQNVVVTYTAGSSTVDANVVLAARIIIAHLYQVGQQGRRGRNSNDDVVVLASGFAVPRRAVELVRNRGAYRMPGFA